MVLTPQAGFAPSPIRVSGLPGVHVVVGGNNSGKTRFLDQFCKPESVQFEWVFEFKPHHRDPQAEIRRYLSPNASGYTGNFMLRWDRQGQLTGVDPKSSGAGEVANSLRPHTKARPYLFLPSGRLFSTEGGAGASPSETPSPDAVVPWYFAKVNDERSEHRTRAAEIRAAFRDLTEGLDFEVFAEGTTVRACISGKQPQRRLAECGEGLRDLFFIISCVLGKPDADLFIDEPGLRLHTSLQRRLLRFLVENAKNRAMWLASHDGVFVGDASIKSHVRIHRNGDVSCVEPLANADQRRDALLSLGWEPSDAVLSDTVLLCEGSSDQIAFDAVLDSQGTVGAMVRELGGSGPVFGKGDQLKSRLHLAKSATPYLRFAALLDSDGLAATVWNDVERRFQNEKIPISKLSFIDLEACWLEAGLAYAILSAAARAGEDETGLPVVIPDKQTVDAQVAAQDIKTKGAERFEQLFQPHHLIFKKVAAATVAVREIQREGDAWTRLSAEVKGALDKAVRV